MHRKQTATVQVWDPNIQMYSIELMKMVSGCALLWFQLYFHERTETLIAFNECETERQTREVTLFRTKSHETENEIWNPEWIYLSKIWRFLISGQILSKIPALLLFSQSNIHEAKISWIQALTPFIAHLLRLCDAFESHKWYDWNWNISSIDSEKVIRRVSVFDYLRTNSRIFVFIEQEWSFDK